LVRIPPSKLQQTHFAHQTDFAQQTPWIPGTGQNFNRGFAELARAVDVQALVDAGGGGAALTSRVRSAFAAYTSPVPELFTPQF
jgi:hypothetical protein